MSIIGKAIQRFRRVELPALSPAPSIKTMSGRYAYLCVDPQCQALMERAPKGACECCGQGCIVSVQGLVHLAQRVAREQRKLHAKTPDKGQARRASEKNSAAYLTDFRAD